MRACGKRELGQAIMTAWMAKRLDCEKSLQGLRHYMDEFLAAKPPPDLTEAMAEAELTRMAMGWGLTVEDIEPDDVAV